MSEWISVKERLPDNIDPVLVSRYNKKLKISSVHIDQYMGFGKWFDKDYNKDVWEITHWMGMPESPNIDQNKHTHIIEVSDEAIFTVKDKWFVINMDSEHLGKALRSCVDYCTNKRSVLD